MAQVTILVNGKPTVVDEVKPGLFGSLGYSYVGASPTVTPTSQPTPVQTTRTPQPVNPYQSVIPGTTGNVLPQVPTSTPVSTGNVSNISTSIVDFLKSKGLDSTFSYRKQLYESLGLQNQYGEYIGDERQNPALLQALSSSERTTGVTISPANIVGMISSVNKTGATSTLSTITQPTSAVTPTVTPTTTPITTTPTDTGMPNWLTDLVGQALPDGGQIPTAEEVAKRATEEVFGKTSFGIQQAETEADKEALKVQQQKATETFIQDIAKRGLTFSGIRSKGLASIEAETLAKQLGIDRKYALMIATGLESAAEKLVKEAKSELKTGQTEARNALSALGYVLLSDGTLVQKPSETRAEESAIRAQESAERAEERFQISMSEQAKGEKEKVVPWSQWAAEKGIVGVPLETGQQIAKQDAQNQKIATKEREIASVRAGIYSWLQNDEGLDREQLLDKLVALHKNLSRSEIATEVYGLTKHTEQSKKFLGIF